MRYTNGVDDVKGYKTKQNTVSTELQSIAEPVVVQNRLAAAIEGKPDLVVNNSENMCSQ